MPKATSAGPSNQHEERVSVNEDGNPASVLEQEPIDAGEPEEGTEPTETAEQDQDATEVPDTVPEPPEVPQDAVEDDAAKAARLQAELDALKGGS